VIEGSQPPPPQMTRRVLGERGAQAWPLAGDTDTLLSCVDSSRWTIALGWGWGGCACLGVLKSPGSFPSCCLTSHGGGGKELALMISSSLSTSPHHGVSLSHPTLSYNRYPSHAQN
jgi:hypothetical protein